MFGKVFQHALAYGFRCSVGCDFKTWPTVILIIANAAMYVFTSSLSSNFMITDDWVIGLYGQFNAYVFQGAYWQLLTSMFVHVNLFHLASNMLFLFIFGLRAEELFSTEEYYLIYFASGLAGNLLTLVTGPDYLSAGASGAIFGIFGANVIFLRRTVRQPIIVSLMYAFTFFILISFSPGTNVLAHLGGLVAGLTLGYVLAGTKKFVMVRAPYAVLG